MDTATSKIAVSVPEACAISGLGRNSLYDCINDGRLTPRKFGRRTLIVVSELRDMIDALPKAKAAA